MPIKSPTNKENAFSRSRRDPPIESEKTQKRTELNWQAKTTHPKMKNLLLICLLLFGCKAFKNNATTHRTSANHTQYPFLIFKDTVRFPSGDLYVPIRKCNDATDSINITFHGLTGLKFNEFKHVPFRIFDTLVVKKVFEKRCLNLQSNETYHAKLSISEYNKLNPDSLLKKYFNNGAPYGNDSEDNWAPPRDFLIAWLVLFDNHFIVSKGDGVNIFYVKKAPTDEQIKQSSLANW